ncbi:MAG: hypothetical protein JO256_01945, partial [Alphaproteobacteria bacterium]|nr:hypothetical protein [Alphaproteobacteria bacterium]
MAWYATGTVAVTNGSPNLVFSGANLVTNKAAIAGMGIQIQGDSRTYELATVDSDSTGTLSVNWPGSTASGLTFKVVPIQGFQV